MSVASRLCLHSRFMILSFTPWYRTWSPMNESNYHIDLSGLFTSHAVGHCGPVELNPMPVELRRYHQKIEARFLRKTQKGLDSPQIQSSFRYQKERPELCSYQQLPMYHCRQFQRIPIPLDPLEETVHAQSLFC